MGANRSMLQLIIELRRLRVEPTVLLPISHNELGLIEELEKNNIPYIEAPIRWIKHPSIWKVVPNYFYSIILRKFIIKQLGNLSFDLVHSNSSVIDIGKYIASKLQVKHIWHMREFGDIDYNLKTPFGKRFQKKLYKGDNHFIAISKEIYNHYSLFIPKRSLHLIYNGVKSLNINKCEINEVVQFCIVGMLHKNKGQLDVLKAVDELVNNRKIDVFHLTLIGGGDQLFTDELNSFVLEHGLSSYVDFTGYNNNISEILSHMDVGIMASANEAFGRVTIEYMMSGLAVISSDGGANKEIIQEGQTGLFYHVGDTKALADRMEELISNPKLIIKLAHKGREFSVIQFSSSKNTKKIFDLYKTILDN